MEDLYNVKVTYQDMPATVKAFTVCNDGYYTIVLNSQLSHYQNILSYMHELEHIVDGDFSAGILSADAIEDRQHR